MSLVLVFFVNFWVLHIYSKFLFHDFLRARFSRSLCLPLRLCPVFVSILCWKQFVLDFFLSLCNFSSFCILIRWHTVCVCAFLLLREQHIVCYLHSPNAKFECILLFIPLACDFFSISYSFARVRLFLCVCAFFFSLLFCRCKLTLWCSATVRMLSFLKMHSNSLLLCRYLCLLLHIII